MRWTDLIYLGKGKINLKTVSSNTMESQATTTRFFTFSTPYLLQLHDLRPYHVPYLMKPSSLSFTPMNYEVYRLSSIHTKGVLSLR